MMESQFRAQVFASMRFSAIGPDAEAKLLRGKLASQGVHLHIISLLAGESITRGVFDTMAKCDAFIAMATKDVRVPACLLSLLTYLDTPARSTVKTRATLRRHFTKCACGRSNTSPRASRSSRCAW